MYCRIRLAVLIAVVIFMTGAISAMAADRVSFVQRPDDEFLILGFEINGIERSEGIEAYLPTGAGTEKVLVPLQALIDALSYAIEVNPGDGLAEGWFAQEDNVFQLDLLNRNVIIKSDEIAYPAQGIEAHEDDIYVAADILEKWFSLSIELDFSNLLLVVKSKKDLPFQERLERQKKAERLKRKSTGLVIDPASAYFIPYKLLSLPSLLFQDTLMVDDSPEERRYESTKNLQLNMDVYGLGADLNVTHISSSRAREEITSARLTFSRRDPKNRLLGSLEAGKLEIGDVSFPPTPLFTGAKRGSGILISSDPELGFRNSSEFSTFILDGDAPVNWDAELFRNGQFVDFQIVSSDGRFLFEDLELINGFNLFKVVLYGPEGQVEVITREVFLGPKMLKDGEFAYEFTAGKPQADFLPIAVGANKDHRKGVSAEAFYGVNKFVTVGGSIYDGPEDDEEVSAQSFSVAAAAFGLNTEFITLFANDDRRGYQATVRGRPLGVNSAITHTKFENFLEDDQELKKETQISLSKDFKFINVTFIGTKSTFLDKEDEKQLQSIASTDIFGVKLTNNLIRTFSDDKQADDFEGDLSMLTDLLGFRMRGNLSYDLDDEAVETFTTFRLSAQRSFENNSSLRLNGNYEFATDIYTVDARYSHEFGPVTADFILGGSNNDNFNAGIALRTGLQPSGADGKLRLVDPRHSALASLGVRAFVDKNGNQEYDEGEDFVEDIIFRSSRSGTKAQTDETGIAWLYGMVESPTRILVSTEDIPSIYVVPARKEFDLIPRRGANSIIDFPFTMLGEVDGFVLVEGTEEPIGNLPIRIINTQTGEEIDEMETEFDGYYVFSALPLGQYKVITSYGWFEEGEPDTTSTIIDLTPEESLILDTNLYLPPETIEDIEAEINESAL